MVFYQKPGVRREGQAACVMANFNRAETLHHAAWINECQRNSGNREAWKNPSGPVMECAVLHHVTPRLKTSTTPAPGMIGVCCIHLMRQFMPFFHSLYLHLSHRPEQFHKANMKAWLMGFKWQALSETQVFSPSTFDSRYTKLFRFK